MASTAWRLRSLSPYGETTTLTVLRSSVVMLKEPEAKEARMEIGVLAGNSGIGFLSAVSGVNRWFVAGDLGTGESLEAAISPVPARPVVVVEAVAEGGCDCVYQPAVHRDAFGAGGSFD